MFTLGEVRNRFNRYFPGIEYSDAELKAIAGAMTIADENGVMHRVDRCLRYVSDSVCNRGVPIKVCFVDGTDLMINSVGATYADIVPLGGVDLLLPKEEWADGYGQFMTQVYCFTEGYSLGRRAGKAEADRRWADKVGL